MSGIDDIFDISEDIIEDNSDIIDGLDIVNIDIESISTEADNKAKTLIEDLAKFYYDEEFLKSNPNFRRRVDNDMESLRMLLKMRSADEVTHDVLIKAIAANSGNASLYMSLTRIQDSILKITTKIESIVNNLTNMIKGYQLEINWNAEQNIEGEIDENSLPEDVEELSATRGTKAFIQKMNAIEKNKQVDNEDTL